MYITKCDICKKTIKDSSEEVRAGHSYGTYHLCEKCGQPIIDFLIKHKLDKDSAMDKLKELAKAKTSKTK
jgi:hypothetical protein